MASTSEWNHLEVAGSIPTTGKTNKILNTCTQSWLTELEQSTPVVQIKGSVWGCVDSRVWHKTLEGRKTYQQKHCDYNNKEEVNSLNILSNNKPVWCKCNRTMWKRFNFNQIIKTKLILDDEMMSIFLKRSIFYSHIFWQSSVDKNILSYKLNRNFSSNLISALCEHLKLQRWSYKKKKTNKNSVHGYPLAESTG